MSHSQVLKRVLVVEDDPDIQTVIRLSLEKVGGFVVETCNSGMEAVKKAPVFSPDIIIMDVMMAGMDGPSTVEVLRKDPRLNSVPVVFLTAKMQSSEVEQYKGLGVVDVIGKPFNPMTLPQIISEIWSDYIAIEEIEEDMNSLRARFEQRLPERFREIELICEGLFAGMQDDTELKSLAIKLHNLEGAGFTYGLSSVGEACRSFGALIEKMAKGGLSGDEHLAQARSLLGTLREAVKAKREVSDPGPCSVQAVISRPLPSAERKLIYLVEDDADVAGMIALQVECFGYTVRSFSRLESFREALKHTTPSAIIMDVVLCEGDRAGIETISELRQTLRGTVPVIFLTARTDFISRLSSVRARAKAYLTKPVDVNVLVGHIDALLTAGEPETEPYRVLIVEDDRDQADYYGHVLEKAGMLARRVTMPTEAIESLFDFNPDLILMDLYLHECNGFELAIIIRQYESYVSVPIVFLSRETNVAKHLTGLRLGGDDFLTKPIFSEHLISSITARVKRARTLRSFMMRDGMTGLYNHSSITEQLEKALATAKRKNRPLVFAMIDLDYFKQVNDTYGHPTGDRVLRSLSILFRQRLRLSDIVGRYGGEEFAVVLPDTDVETATSILEEVRESFSKINHQAGTIKFNITLSCGIAAYPGYNDSRSIIDAADMALYESKHSGRNKVCINRASPQVTTSLEQRSQ